MKKIFIFIALIISLAACNIDSGYTYHLKYVVFYPGNNDTVTTSNSKPYSFYSYDGSNYIKKGDEYISSEYRGTSPYKVIYHYKTKKSN